MTIYNNNENNHIVVAYAPLHAYFSIKPASTLTASSKCGGPYNMEVSIVSHIKGTAQINVRKLPIQSLLILETLKFQRDLIDEFNLKMLCPL